VSCSRTHRLGQGLHCQPPHWKTDLCTDPQWLFNALYSDMFWMYSLMTVAVTRHVSRLRFGISRLENISSVSWTQYRVTKKVTSTSTSTSSISFGSFPARCRPEGQSLSCPCDPPVCGLCEACWQRRCITTGKCTPQCDYNVQTRDGPPALCFSPESHFVNKV